MEREDLEPFVQPLMEKANRAIISFVSIMLSRFNIPSLQNRSEPGSKVAISFFKRRSGAQLQHLGKNVASRHSIHAYVVT